MTWNIFFNPGGAVRWRRHCIAFRYDRKTFFSLLYSFVDRMKLGRQAGNLRNTAMTGIFVFFVKKATNLMEAESMGESSESLLTQKRHLICIAAFKYLRPHD